MLNDYMCPTGQLPRDDIINQFYNKNYQAIKYTKVKKYVNNADKSRLILSSFCQRQMKSKKEIFHGTIIVISVFYWCAYIQ